MAFSCRCPKMQVHTTSGPTTSQDRFRVPLSMLASAASEATWTSKGGRDKSPLLRKD